MNILDGNFSQVLYGHVSGCFSEAANESHAGIPGGALFVVFHLCLLVFTAQQYAFGCGKT